jgi:hypothetical protein
LDKRYIAAEKTYRAIGRFIFEFSQVEHTIRHYVGESIGLNGKYFSDIVESYDIAMLCNIAESVFEKSLHKNMVAKLKPLISNFRAFKRQQSPRRSRALDAVPRWRDRPSYVT